MDPYLPRDPYLTPRCFTPDSALELARDIGVADLELNQPRMEMDGSGRDNSNKPQKTHKMMILLMEETPVYPIIYMV